MFGRHGRNSRGMGRGAGFGYRWRAEAEAVEIAQDQARLPRHVGDPESLGGPGRRGMGRGLGRGFHCGLAGAPAWRTAGAGQGGGRGRGAGRGGGGSFGGGRGRNRGGAFGAGGFCVCAGCGHKEPHQAGIKCTGLKCSECGHTMVREELLNQHKQTGDQK